MNAPAFVSNTPRPLDGDTSLPAGMNSQRDPLSLPPGGYFASMNSVNRGGLVQCRPGYEFKFNMPPGRIQGAALFSPTNDLEYLVFAIGGLVYTSQYPYKEYEKLDNILFRDDSEAIYFCQAEKASTVQEDGSIKLITPFKVMLMQDGFTAPGVWDGSTNEHLTDPNDTPLGTAMCWSGDRLWVARRQEIFASDINDPLSFREGLYISNARSFLLDKPVVALAEVTSKSDVQLLAFTETSTTAFQSGVRKRSEWETTPKFQQLLFPNLGCVSHRSVATQYGLLWWYSRFGLTNFNAAVASFLTSEFRYQDTEMGASKAYIGDISKIAVAVHENYILVSVPYSDKYNTHTWVLDKGPVEGINTDSPNAWNSYWTGTRPSDWVFGPIQGLNRIFQFSTDYDGKNRCWEAFSGERTDNGCPVTWTLETRAYTGNNTIEKDFRFVEMYLAELQGSVDLAVFWTGVSKGSYKRCLQKRIVATEGSIQQGEQFDITTSRVFSLKKQYRRIVSSDVKNSPPEQTSCKVESAQTERTDIGFQLLFVCSGPGAVRGLRVFTSGDVPDVRAGVCEENEVAPNFVRFDGAGSEMIDTLNDGPPEFASEEDNTSVNGFTGEGDAVSVISQTDADKVATCHANNQVEISQAWQLPKYVGNPANVI